MDLIRSSVSLSGGFKRGDKLFFMGCSVYTIASGEHGQAEIHHGQLGEVKRKGLRHQRRAKPKARF